MIDIKNPIYKSRIEVFVEESNRIESVFDSDAHQLALDKTIQLLALPYIDIADLSRFNTNGELRDRYGMNVIVGSHVPPEGSMMIMTELNKILRRVAERESPYKIHQDFETLHPYMDGNGRTGRVLWLWQMIHQQGYQLEFGFLHKYYYQSLDFGR